MKSETVGLNSVAELDFRVRLAKIGYLLIVQKLLIPHPPSRACVRGREYSEITETLHIAHTKSIIVGLLKIFGTLDACVGFVKLYSD